MVTFLRKKFIKDYENVKNQGVREAHGKMASVVGIISNLFLFLLKLIIGLISGTISIVTDAINNLSDMASSVVSLVGFKLASMPADEEHPYGHERLEYIAGFIVAILVIFIGGALGYTSVMKMINYHYEPLNYTVTYISIGILLVSILVKIWQAMFNLKVGKIIGSVALKATASDSRNDVIATSAVLLGVIVTLILELNEIKCPFSIDGALGILVSLFIMISGILLVHDTANPLIGLQVPAEYRDEVIDYIKGNPMVLGVHDIVCHMYGPTKCFMTLHAEVDAKNSIIDAHDAIDAIEKGVQEKYGILLTIHMDPVEIGNPYSDAIREEVRCALYALDKELTFHDFRVIRKTSKDTVLFDILVPFNYKMTNEEIESYLKNELKVHGRDVSLSINFDHKI